MNTRHFDHAIRRWRDVVAGLPDPRTGNNCSYSMADIALSAFAVFFTQSPSFLSFQQNMQKAHGRNNARSLFQVERIPCDNHIRETLDSVEARELFGLFDDVYQAFEGTGLLQDMRAAQNTRLIALDATWYFSSQKLHCQNCSCLRHTDGTTTHYHSAITPVIVSPGHSQVVPLRPEFIRPQDGQAKQDCEINAAKRWLAAHATQYSTGNDPLLGDDLYAHPPFCRQVLLPGLHVLFTCQPASPAHLSGWIEGLEPGRLLHRLKLRVKGQGTRWEHQQYRWANRVPLTDNDDALNVNWCELTITDGEGRLLYRNAFITDWEISADNGSGLVAAGRARWTIEHEHNNVLTTQGYHREHHFGHGQQHLSSVLLSLNRLAFGLHTVLEVADARYRLVRAAGGARRQFFQPIEALTAYWFFASWEGLMDFRMRGQEVGSYAVNKG